MKCSLILQIKKTGWLILSDVGRLDALMFTGGIEENVLIAAGKGCWTYKRSNYILFNRDDDGSS